jgi:hypothetical protein
MIPECLILDDRVGVPIYMSDEHCFIQWEEEQGWDTVLKKCNIEGWPGAYHKFTVWPSQNDEDICEFKVSVYEIRCFVTEIKYLLISYDEIMEWDNIFHCVCLPYNRLNLLKFYSDFLALIGQAKYYSG